MQLFRLWAASLSLFYPAKLWEFLSLFIKNLYKTFSVWIVHWWWILGYYVFLDCIAPILKRAEHAAPSSWMLAKLYHISSGLVGFLFLLSVPVVLYSLYDSARYIHVKGSKNYFISRLEYILPVGFFWVFLGFTIPQVTESVIGLFEKSIFSLEKSVHLGGRIVWVLFPLIVCFALDGPDTFEHWRHSFFKALRMFINNLPLFLIIALVIFSLGNPSFIDLSPFVRYLSPEYFAFIVGRFFYIFCELMTAVFFMTYYYQHIAKHKKLYGSLVD